LRQRVLRRHRGDRRGVPAGRRLLRRRLRHPLGAHAVPHGVDPLHGRFPQPGEAPQDLRRSDRLKPPVRAHSSTRRLTSPPMRVSTHAALPDERNADIEIYINGEFYPRNEAKVSVFDSAFLVGDGIWEGIRLHEGRFAFLDRHLDRLFQAAAATRIDIGMSRQELTEALYATVERNGMHTDVHVRLMISRGTKSTPSQHPSNLVSGPTVVIIAEHKRPDPEVYRRGISLFTATIRRPPARHPRPAPQLPLEAARGDRPHPGDRGGSRRGADAGPDGSGRHLQRHQLLHRLPRRVVDFDGPLQPGRHHPGRGPGGGPGRRHPRPRGAVLADRRLLGRRGFRHGDVRGDNPGPFRRRADDRHRDRGPDHVPHPRAVPGRRREGGGGVSVVRISVWSGPRNVSTALMYSFRQRSDTAVVDEPLYAHYLAATGVEHPGREEVLAAQDTDGERVVRDVILGPSTRPVLFLKNMAHHLVGLDWAFLSELHNVILTRDPAELPTSYIKQVPNPTLEG